MSHRITCRCGKRIAIEDDYPFDHGRCPRCGTRIEVKPPSRHEAPALPTAELPPHDTGEVPRRERPIRGSDDALVPADGAEEPVTLPGEEGEGETLTPPPSRKAMISRLAGPTEPMLPPRGVHRARSSSLPLLLVTLVSSVLPLAVVVMLLLQSQGQIADLAGELSELRAHTPRREQGGHVEPHSSGATKPGPTPISASPGADSRLERALARVEQLEQQVAALRTRTASAPTVSLPASGAFERRLIAVAETASPAVVALVTENGAGSGVVISEDGYILTNDHVVGGRRQIVAHFPTGDRYRARILASDAKSDISLIKVEARDLAAIQLGDSSKLNVGQVVVALGNPFGLSRDGKPTMTLGIVSALHRIVSPGAGRRRYGDAIQTDAAINPGNSGGALVDLEGRLIGINGAISSRTGSSAGVGFAIPVNFIKRILPRLRRGQATEPGYLGVQTRDMTPEQIKQVGVRGAWIASVMPDSPAAEAGLQANTVITHFDGKPVASSTELINRISYHQVGDTIRLRVHGGNGSVAVEVKIGRLQQQR